MSSDAWQVIGAKRGDTFDTVLSHFFQRAGDLGPRLIGATAERRDDVIREWVQLMEAVDTVAAHVRMTPQPAEHYQLRMEDGTAGVYALVQLIGSDMPQVIFVPTDGQPFAPPGRFWSDGWWYFFDQAKGWYMPCCPVPPTGEPHSPNCPRRSSR